MAKLSKFAAVRPFLSDADSFLKRLDSGRNLVVCAVSNRIASAYYEWALGPSADISSRRQVSALGGNADRANRDIIVKQHAGSIEVDTLPGEFTEFRIVLTRTATSL